MSRRVSLKGRGADLFFGGDVQDGVSSGDSVAATIPASEVADPPNQITDEEQADGLSACLHASEEAEGSDLLEPTGPVPPDPAAEITAAEVVTGTALLDAIWPRLCDRAAITNAFRYTDQELVWLTDVLYAVNKTYGLKVSKQDVARLGLLAVLQEYHDRGEASLLVHLVQRRRRERGTSV